ncbi:MAG: CHAT domain-containing tetratricopeptide repeat protein [Blastocatellia bacterium]
MKRYRLILVISCVLGLSTQGDAQNASVQDARQLISRAQELMRSDRFDEALVLAERVLGIAEKLYDPEHPEVASAIQFIGEISAAKGDYSRAEPLYKRALAIRAKRFGAEDLWVASSLHSLAKLYLNKGDYARAEPLFTRALAIEVKKLGPDHPSVALLMNNYAMLCSTQGDYRRAEQLLQRSLAIYEKVAGPEDGNVGRQLGNLASLYYQQADYARAEPLFLRALAIELKTHGPDHSAVASLLHNLAALYRKKGEYSRAEPLYKRALEIYVKSFGPEHTLVASMLEGVADLYRDKGDYRQAVQFFRRALEIREHNLNNLILTSGSEEQKQLYLNALSGETDLVVSMHLALAPADEQAAQLALTAILRRKGRALDAMTDQIASLRQRATPEDHSMLDQLASTRSKLATMQLSGSGGLTPEARQTEIARLGAAVEQLENEVSRRSGQFRALVQSVTLDSVRQALPADSALVEVFSYRPFDSKAADYSRRFGPPRYVAYVLKRDAAAPQFAELGVAASIDEVASKLRAALQDPKTSKINGKVVTNITEAKTLARALDERLMRPVRRLLGATRHVFLSPDGALNLIPFAALVDEQGRYLVENYTFSYLTSGRDLLRLQIARESRAAAPVVLGNPLFDMAAARNQQLPVTQANATATPVTPNRRSVDFSSLTYDPLPGTEDEAKALYALLPGAQILLQQQATEAALKQVRAPRVLHIATHGFFLPDQPSEANANESRALTHINQAEKAGPRQAKENPLLRSGLVLAGVKQQQSGRGEDGVLTALEAAGLDLWGTQLVVLSACETGLGEIRNGAGVYGLRRALVLAGSETQVISLWSVNDESTRDLMVGFYKRLQAGEGRAEALRNVQLAMLGAKTPEHSKSARGAQVVKGASAAQDFSHPYYWAPFIESGAWTSMAAPAR